MPTNDNINYGPTAVPPGKLTTGYAYTPPAPIGIPVTEQPVVAPTVSNPVVIPVTEQLVDIVPGAVAVPYVVPTANQQRYITILANGTVVTTNATTLNFTGNGVAVSNLGTTGANIVINTSGGSSNYNDSDVATFLAAFGSNTVLTTGNVTGGNLLTGAQVIANGVIQTGTGFSTGGYLSVNGDADLHKTNVTGNLSATGNITGNYFIGNGSQLTGLAATYGNANVVANLAALGTNPVSTTGNVTGGNVLTGGLISATSTITSAANITGGNVRTAGLVSATGNVSGNYFIGNGSQLTGISAGANTGNVTFNDVNIIGTGNLHLQPDPANSGAYLDIYLTAVPGPDIHIAGNGENVIIGRDAGANVLVAVDGTVSIQANAGTPYTWTFGYDGNLTLPGNAFAVNYANGTAVSLGGSYGNANVVANLAALGSNPISTTGNITGGNLDLSYMGGAARGNLTGGNISVTGNITGGNIITAGLLSTTGNVRGGNILTAGAVSASSTITGANLSTGGTVSATGNVAGGNIVTGGLITATGNITTSGNILNQGFVSSTGNAIHGNILTGGLVSAAGNITASNVFSSATMSTGGNIFAALNISATGTVYGSNFNTTGLISAGGNVTVGNILTAGIASATGNIVTAGNFVGNGAALTNVTVSVAGNVIGTQSNVTLVAGSYNWTFNNAGNLTLPGNTFAVNYANTTPVNVVTRFEAAWTVPVGNSTQSFTVTPNETYYLWVDCNIPNGILTWNATATVTNTNVPVVGVQYAWVYGGGGTPIDFTSIPNQFIGTANAIVRSNVAPSSTTNRFDFGINNTSGGNVTVSYGYVKIS